MKTLTLLFVFCLGLKFSSAQHSDSEISEIKEAIDKSIRLSFHKNKNLRLVAASMFITFAEDASIENIFFSETPEGLFRTKETIDNLERAIKKLKLDRKSFSNKYVIAILVIGSSQRLPEATTEIPENWQQLFKGIDIQSLAGKDLKYCVPVAVEYLGSITD